MMYTYIINITIYEICIHDLLEFELKTSPRHANVFAIKLHNLFLVKYMELSILSSQL
jgi:hypothetical protein